MKILLTDEEIENAEKVVTIEYLGTLKRPREYSSVKLDRLVTDGLLKAQLKGIVKLLDECKLPVEHGSRIFVMGEELWQALLKECE